MTKVLDDLKAARELIADPARWTTGSYARDARGNPASIKDGVCFCAEGALGKVISRGEFEPCVGGGEAQRALAGACRHLFSESIDKGEYTAVVHVNDEIGHAAILEAFDLAIQREAER